MAGNYNNKESQIEGFGVLRAPKFSNNVQNVKCFSDCVLERETFFADLNANVMRAHEMSSCVISGHSRPTLARSHEAQTGLTENEKKYSEQQRLLRTLISQP